ncbi:cytochrome P450 [Frankia sp. AiPs1]|uniref:cytochrome P450 n=1 Tax=Frankia sp. AiPs1 TaxID=573493 RepID=UPI002042D0AE|nr:cytochrome P450 [Frankia sp. AiPs1]MCM3923601.1 cytochrome P450 [Frankia sp. AiPs1]
MGATLTVGTAQGELPLLGHAMRLRNDPLNFLGSLKDAGDLVRIKLGPQTAYVLCHPDLVQQVLLDERTFDKQGPLWDKLRKFTGDGIGTCPFDRHRRQRRIVQPAFHQRHMRHYSEIMIEEAALVTDSWSDGQTIDILDEMYDITTRVMARTLASTHGGMTATTEVCRAMDVVMAGTYQRATSPLRVLERLPTPGNRRFEDAGKRINAAVDAIIRTYREAAAADQPDQADQLDPADAEGQDWQDILSVMMDGRDDSGHGLTDTELRDQIIILATAGMETTASAISWTFGLLARHPEIERQLHEEVDAVLAGRPATWDDLPKLRLTERVVKEALRLYPPGWLFTRSTTRDTELAGHPLPAGTTIFYSPYILHRRPDLFAEPDRFDPDRWLEDRARDIPRGAYIPFGTGGRKCIGDMFAMIEAPLTVSSIAARWQLVATTANHRPPPPQLALNPRSMPLRLRARQPAH